MNIRKYAACFTVLGVLSLPAQAVDNVLTFTDLGENPDLAPSLSQYEGFTWSNFNLLGSYLGFYQDRDSGYRRMYEQSGQAILNAGARDASLTRTDGGLFDFGSADMIGAWHDDLNVTVSGWLNGTVQYTKTVTLDSIASSAQDFNFTGIDKLTFSSFGGVKNPLYDNEGAHFVMDNVSFSATAPVPEPSTYAMLFVGLAMIGLAVRRHRPA